MPSGPKEGAADYAKEILCYAMSVNLVRDSYYFFQRYCHGHRLQGLTNHLVPPNTIDLTVRHHF